MIFVETSAIVAMLLDEPDADTLMARLDDAESAFTSVVAMFEAALVLSSRKGIAVAAALDIVKFFTEQGGISIQPLTPAILNLAAEAADRFGKGRGHKAQLNLCDCLAYASCRDAGAAMLFTGNDFGRTDIVTA
ncbi:MAG: type II toxin-antitoxin system VapC family toxin [Bosea sp. (in: a-proteobacteria)]